MKRRRAIFIDRGHLQESSTLHPDPISMTKLEAIRKINAAGLQVVCITNQPEVAAGKIDEWTIEDLHEDLRNQLAEHDLRLDGIYYCPHAECDACECRKPKLLLFERAHREMGIDLKASFVLGSPRVEQQVADQLGAQFIAIKSPLNETQEADNGELKDAVSIAIKNALETSGLNPEGTSPSLGR